MPDSRTITGSRDDLVVDVSRCLRMRFNASDCRRCAEICPHGAVTLEGGLTVNGGLCRGCMLCTAVCPTGAVEQKSDFGSCLTQLARVADPVLGCMRSKERSNAALTCLGGLSEEHLMTLCHSLSGKLTLNLSLCGDCPDSAAIHHLRQHLETLAKAGLLEGSGTIVTAESSQDISYRDESVDRRGFFNSFRNALFQSAAVILSADCEQTDRRTEYAGKRLPVRRELLNRVRNKLSQELLVRSQAHFDAAVSFSDACTMCQGCVAICPTGALRTELADIPPIFDQSLCTGCGLCSEFCLDEALQFRPAN